MNELKKRLTEIKNEALYLNHYRVLTQRHNFGKEERTTL
jgi:hypothetical protein